MRFDYLVAKQTLQGLACLHQNNVVDDIEVAVANNTRKVRKRLEELLCQRCVVELKKYTSNR